MLQVNAASVKNDLATEPAGPCGGSCLQVRFLDGPQSPNKGNVAATQQKLLDIAFKVRRLAALNHSDVLLLVQAILRRGRVINCAIEWLTGCEAISSPSMRPQGGFGVLDVVGIRVDGGSYLAVPCLLVPPLRV